MTVTWPEVEFIEDSWRPGEIGSAANAAGSLDPMVSFRGSSSTASRVFPDGAADQAEGNWRREPDALVALRG